MHAMFLIHRYSVVAFEDQNEVVADSMSNESTLALQTDSGPEMVVRDVLITLCKSH